VKRWRRLVAIWMARPVPGDLARSGIPANYPYLTGLVTVAGIVWPGG